ncbi:MAG: hypothetical protein K2H53_05555 [Clostridia bacterium]|nr:hypothetical protein [Clostridia bacterium]
MTQTAQRMRPTVLTIYRQDNQIKTRLHEVAIYACLSSYQHLYGRLVTKDSDKWPKYIRLKRGLSSESKSKVTYAKKKYTHVRELVIESNDPPKFSKNFLEFTGDDRCKIEDIDENFETKFYSKIFVSED